MNNIIICFAGGTGGHFIGSICWNLLFKKKFSVLSDGSMHSFRSKYQKSNFLSGRLLDLSDRSFQQESDVINTIGNVDIVLGHFRNLKLLEEKIYGTVQ